MQVTIVMTHALTIPDLLDRLEEFHGEQEPCWPVDPYSFLIWWHCGYPASDATCARGWKALQNEVGIAPSELLGATQTALAHALKAGGMVPEVRAMRVQQIAARVQNEFGGDLRGALVGSLTEVRKLLKKFPGIADPGADRILLFGQCAPVAAIPSNCPHVLVRIRSGLERENYGMNYREAQALIEDEVPPQFGPRKRAFLLLKQHGQATCKRVKPKCDTCPVSGHCAYFAGKNRGRVRPA